MIHFELKDFIDIFLVALFLYYIFRLMKQSSAANIFSGIIIFILVWIIVKQFFNLRLLGTIFDTIINMGALALVILFQEEIRRFFSTIGVHHSQSYLIRFFRSKRSSDHSHENIFPIVMACMNMGRAKIGALIVVERLSSLSDIADTGDIINANINQRLIENIFFKNSPLHDGAMIISRKLIRAAGCILPVSHSLDIPKELGLRHRAALGISQETDAIAIVVSEETGRIAVAIKGQFHLRLSAENLESILTKELDL